jgi:hypothetical protein
LISLSFAEFVDFFFAREVVSEEDLTDLRGEQYFDSVPSLPEVLVKHLTGLFTDFGRIAGVGTALTRRFAETDWF